MSLVAPYSDSGESSGGEGPAEDMTAHLRPIQMAPAPVCLTPAVNTTLHDKTKVIVDPTAGPLVFNPTVDQMYLPEQGPENPFKSEMDKVPKNTLTGMVEGAHVSAFQFENQRRTYNSYGFAVDPLGDFIGSEESFDKAGGKSVFESGKAKREFDKRKRQRNTDAGDVEGYLGPWGKYADEETVSKPPAEDHKFLEEYLIKKAKKKGKSGPGAVAADVEETSALHIESAYDYQGRSFVDAVPQDIGINLRSPYPPEKCFLPKRQMHAWKGHTKAVAAIRWFPKTAHLLLSSSMDSKVKIWEVYHGRRNIRTYAGHSQAVRDVAFNNDGKNFLSASYDRYIKLWDTETGQVVSKFTNKKIPYCVKFNPDDDKQNLFVAGTADKKIVCWDTRTGEIMQEYDRHLGAVNTITFVDQNRRMVTTSDDKTIRVWEWNVPVDFLQLQDPSMHSMPAVTVSPNGKWLCCQSMDNQIITYNCLSHFKQMKKKTFKGHMVSGYACGVEFSPCMTYIMSGDADGKVYIWDWKTTKLFSKFKAHEEVCISALWHPHETSKIATAGWDGLAKLWD